MFCNNGQANFKHFSSTVSMSVSSHRGCWKDTAGRRGFCAGAAGCRVCQQCGWQDFTSALPCPGHESRMHGALVTLQPGLDWWSRTLCTLGLLPTLVPHWPLLACFLYPRASPETLSMQTLGAPELLLHTTVCLPISHSFPAPQTGDPCLLSDCGPAHFSATWWAATIPSLLRPEPQLWGGDSLLCLSFLGYSP